MLKPIFPRGLAVLAALLLLSNAHARADFELHGLFSDGMVLQREKPVRIFGFASPNDQISVQIGADLNGESNTDDKGRWSVEFKPIAMGTDVSVIKVHNKTADKKITVNEVLLGDVWVLGGQSNMELELYKIYDGDLEVMSANYPEIRLMTIPKGAGPDTRVNFKSLNEFNSWTSYHEWKGRWDKSTPQTVRNFSGIGFVFGRRLHQVGQVPIGLVDVSRGGTTVETWTSRESLQKIPDAEKMNQIWDQRVADFDPQKDFQQQLKNWERHAEQQRKTGRKPREKPTEQRPGPKVDMNRPANCYNRMLKTMDGLSVRGVIWHQGYNNALGDARPELYYQTFLAMIGDWRSVFRDQELPFGIIGFSAGGQPQTLENFEEQMIDAAPYIREAQFRVARELKNVAYMASWDQQMNWYHPFKKMALGERMARWAMATTMDKKVPWQSPALLKHETVDGKIVLSFDRKIITHDGRDFEGLAIAGEDRRFYPTTGKPFVKGKDERGRDQLDRSRLVVSHPLVDQPVAVRYAWARNPLGNGASDERHGRNIPIPGFRTDQWEFPAGPIVAPGDPAAGKHRQKMRKLRQAAKKMTTERIKAEAKLLLGDQSKVGSAD